MIDLSKRYATVTGHEVRGLWQEGMFVYGFYKELDEWEPEKWDASTGWPCYSQSVEPEYMGLALVEEKERASVSFTVWFHNDGSIEVNNKTIIPPFKSEAGIFAKKDITINVTKGDGLLIDEP